MTQIQEGRIEIELPCALTDEEIQSRGRMLGETIWAIDDTNAARTASMKEFKERLVGLNEQQRKLAIIIGNRVEKRMVRCAVQFHTPCEGMKRVVRLDTGEMVREEPMTDSEKQLNLFAAQQEFEHYMNAQGVNQVQTEPPAEEPRDSDV
ncbi:MAG: hypothetical protein P4K93_16265, partial [Terracidiphilus sp.]|nr:hypothetical protein [Terracidiphilus sp.]